MCAPYRTRFLSICGAAKCSRDYYLCDVGLRERLDCSGRRALSKKQHWGVTDIVPPVRLLTANASALTVSASFAGIVSVANMVAHVNVLLCEGLPPQALLGLKTFYGLGNFMVGASDTVAAFCMHGTSYKNLTSFPAFYVVSAVPPNAAS